MSFNKLILLSLSNSITSRREKSTLYWRTTITVLTISAVIAYYKLSVVFLDKIMVNSGELYHNTAIIYLINLFILAILLLPFFSIELPLFLLTRFSVGKYNILRFIMNKIIFHYFSSYFNYYLKRVLDRLMQYKLLCLFIDFVLSILTYCQYLKSKILIENNLVYLLVFGLLSNVDPNYYGLLISWYYFTLARRYVWSNKEILSNYPVIRKWLINILTINIILLEILLLNIIFTLIFSKLDLIFDYILTMFGPFNGNAGGGNSNLPGPSGNPGGPNGNNLNDPFFGSLGVNNNKRKYTEKMKQSKKKTYYKNREKILASQKAKYAEAKQKTTEKYVREQTELHVLLGADPITALSIATNKKAGSRIAVRLTNTETNETSIYVSITAVSDHLKVDRSYASTALNTGKTIKGKFKVSRLSEIDGEVSPEFFQKMTQNYRGGKNYRGGIPISITNVLTGDVKIFSSYLEATRDKSLNLSKKIISTHVDKDKLAKKIYKIEKM